MSSLRLHSHVLDARQMLAEGREKLRSQHEAGSPGIQLGVYLTELLDRVVLRVVDTVLSQSTDRIRLGDKFALVAHGGYGRRDNAPFSDVDLMLLHHRSISSLIPDLASRLVQDFSDVGFELGFSVRTPRIACQMALKDPVIFTSLAESRLLSGSESFFQRFITQFRRKAVRPSSSVIKAIEGSRLEEQLKYGETVYLLEPNVKRSRGALRDIHLLRWIGFAKYGETNPDKLRMMGHLSMDDYNHLQAAWEFLLRLRNDLHFHAGSSQDVVTREEQLRLAKVYQYSGDLGVLPVERFMQDYFRHTSDVRDIVDHFIATAHWGSPLGMTLHNLLGARVDEDYILGPRYLSATTAGYERVRGDLVEVLRLLDLSNRYNKRIEHDLWHVIRESMTKAEISSISAEAARQFRAVMGNPTNLGKSLRRLHDLRVLEKLVPGFSHVRCLLQFNDYHKYTVDEHSFRAVEQAIDLVRDEGILGRVYRKIKDKTVLHLALLIHDIGKGYLEDHSEVGRRIARDVARHLHLPPDESDSLELLVHRHLMLNHCAFRRDSSDRAILLEVASAVGSPANLRMLFILTCADLGAVGPGVWNSWKLEVLSDLFQRVLETLTGDTGDNEFGDRLAPQREALLGAAQKLEHPDWLRRQIRSLPRAYLHSSSTQIVLDDLQRLYTLPPDRAVAWGRYIPQQGISEYSVGATEDIADGIFHRLTGALTSQGLQILSAEIHSLADSLFLDKFYVQDPDYRGQPPATRFTEVANKLAESLQGEIRPPQFRRLWQGMRDSSTLRPLPTQIKVDNVTSERFTILDVFAHDRAGLLYEIAKSLHEEHLSVRIAKIGTYLDQVVDVFYVTDLEGKKIVDELRIAEIRSRLYHSIEAS